MKSIRQNVLIAAPAEKVYRALTTQEGLAGWWTPAATAKAELNGIARFPFSFPSFEYSKEMKVTELKPNAQVKWECIAGADEWIGTTISFRLEAGDKATLGSAHPELMGQLEQQKTDNGTLVIFEHNDWREYTPMFSVQLHLGAVPEKPEAVVRDGQGAAVADSVPISRRSKSPRYKV